MAIIDRGDRPHPYDRAVQVLPPGAGLVVRRQAWLEAVPSRLFLNHAGRDAGVASEDLEAVIHLRRAGWELWHNPAMVIHHVIPVQRLGRDQLVALFRCIGLSRFYIRMVGLRPWQRPLYGPLFWINDLRRLLGHRVTGWRQETQRGTLREACDRSYLASSFYSPMFLARRALQQHLDRGLNHWLDRWRCPARAELVATLSRAMELRQAGGPGPVLPPGDRSPLGLCIIIPTHNRRASLVNLLRQLSSQLASYSQTDRVSPVVVQLLVVDDGSGDGTGAAIAKEFPQVQVCQGNGQLWWMGSIVTGMVAGMAGEIPTLAAEKIAPQAPDFFLWLNDDLCLADNFLQQLIKLCHQPSTAQQVTGGIVFAQDYPQWIVYSGLHRGQPVWQLDSFGPDAQLPMDTLAGNMVLLPRAILDRVGFPDVLRFPQNGGDYEYLKLVKQRGFGLRLDRDLQATTAYEKTDCLRYMPYWMQWYLQPSLAARWDILRGLVDLKTTQNIWLFVHIHGQPTASPAPRAIAPAETLPPWRYGLCYLDKLWKLLGVSWVPRSRLQPRVQQYLDRHGVPAALGSQLQRRPRR
ncbi:MAG: glycosyltransferase family 2 protein [Synechococcales cyanobacterium RM1_1_8]|nr:glycosyltransferase family 2 protein [Synechococcales cyanobacterium RM1_1_8]